MRPVEPMPHTPQSKQRSPWLEGEPLVVEGFAMRQFWRRVRDGALLAFLGDEPTGWHLSISFRNHRGEHSRYPSWDEIYHARQELTDPHIEFAMFLPPEGLYVNAHDTTFHLHEYPMRES